MTKIPDDQLAKLLEVMTALEPRRITMYVPDGNGGELVMDCVTRDDAGKGQPKPNTPSVLNANGAPMSNPTARATTQWRSDRHTIAQCEKRYLGMVRPQFSGRNAKRGGRTKQC